MLSACVYDLKQSFSLWFQASLCLITLLKCLQSVFLFSNERYGFAVNYELGNLLVKLNNGQCT